MLVLNSVRLKNFKRHEDLLVSLSEGLTVIRGPNWAGKSTVLQAVLFALFGTLAVPGKKDGLTRRGAKDMRVELDFTLNGQGYNLMRSASAATLSMDGVTTATSATAVDEWLSAHLAVDRKTALQLCYSPQTHTSALLTLGVAALNSLVEKVSGATDVEELAEAAAKKSSHFKSKVTTPKTELEDNLSLVEAEIGELVKTQVTATKTMEDSAEVLDEKKSQQAEAKRVLDEARNQEQVRRLALERHTNNQRTIEQLVEAEATLNGLDIDPLKAKADVANMKAQREQDIQTLTKTEALTKWFGTIGEHWKKLEPNRVYLQDHKNLLVQAEADLEKAQDKYNEAQSDSKVLASKLEMATKAMHSATCPTCHRDFEGVDPEALAESEKVAKALWGKSVGAAQEAKSALTEIEKQVQNLKSEVARLSKQVPPDDYEEQFAAKVEEYEALPRVEDVGPALAEAETALAEYTKLADRVAALKEQAHALPDDAGWDDPQIDLVPLEKALSYVDSEVEVAGDLHRKLQGEQQILTYRLSTAEKQKADLSEQIKQIESSEKLAARWDQFAKWLRKSKANFLQSLWDTVLADAGGILSEASGGFATGLSRGEDGEFSVQEGDEWVPASSISGGMAAIAGVALKLALADSLPTAPGFVLLDEPSSELNDQNALNLASALKGREKQVVLVTHRIGEEYLADSLVDLS